jgi:hypothetical protein
MVATTYLPFTLEPRPRSRVRRHLVREPSALGLGVASAVGPAGVLLIDLAGARPATAALATVVTLSGVSIFLRSGRRRITPVGTFAIAGSVFIGLAALVTAPDQRFAVTPQFLHVVALAASAWYLAMAVAAGLDGTRGRSEPKTVGAARPEVPLAVLAWGLLLLAASLVLTLADLRAGRLDSVLGYAGVLLVSAYALAHARLRALPRWPLHLAVVGTAVLTWGAVSFSGGGRLNIATLGLTVLALAVVIGRWRSAKAVVVMALLPALVIAGLVRAERHGGTATVDGVVSEQTGLSSVTSPLRTMATIEADLRDGTIEPTMGDTFASTLLTPLPRGYLPGKPIGFGAVLTAHYAPELVDIGHSMAALAQGEWVWNFGLPGLVGFVVATGCLLHGLERWQRHAIMTARGTAGIVAIVAAVVAMTGVADYLWTGSHTYVVRAGFRVLVLLGVVLVIKVAGQVLPTATARPVDA